MASPFPDVCIAGAGIIGLSLALELDARGLEVTVLDAGPPLGQASSAAAGMLAAGDPENPPALWPLAELSLGLYPDFLARIQALSGVGVPFQTGRTLQALPQGYSWGEVLAEGRLREVCPELVAGGRRFIELEEQSIDPRQLGAALLAAVHAANVKLYAERRFTKFAMSAEGVLVSTSAGTVSAGCFVDCTGAWAAPLVVPKKGQMLSIELPFALETVVRTREVYIVPRTVGPQAGRAVIGATIEDVGFDRTTHDEDIARLRSFAAALLPSLGTATMVEQWAGLRPGTLDELPVLGEIAERHWIAAGHYRNGILLAPGTARVLAQRITGETVAISLESFSPERFG